ncbi:hypothetical protein QQS21_008570 [Conoideocrella luteorostrata]|uniref:Uncharacterized protein n=1 Tax=Conoideocrella luteorostrata TaxID=1105319 RepID=A0AAJ0CIK6_9HYPO|nr:hypothetical protein QQS21_008570 [Conoideocrella luteorostrata]
MSRQINQLWEVRKAEVWVYEYGKGVFELLYPEHFRRQDLNKNEMQNESQGSSGDNVVEEEHQQGFPRTDEADKTCGSQKQSHGEQTTVLRNKREAQQLDVMIIRDASELVGRDIPPVAQRREQMPEIMTLEPISG